MTRLLPFLLVAATIAVAGCGSGSNPPRCSLNGGTTLGSYPWPRFRFDMANTGHTTLANGLAGNEGGELWRFPPPPTPPLPVSIESSPVVGIGQVFFGSSQGQVYVLDTTANGSQITTFTNNLNSATQVNGAITAAPLLGQGPDGENGNVFLATGDGRVLQTENDGNLVHTTSLGGFIGGSPNIGGDGEVYAGSTNGTLAAVCPNGVPRFAVTIAPTAASPAVVTDDFCEAFYDVSDSTTCPRIIIGASDSQVSAFDLLGRQQWAFFASAPIAASVVLQEVPVNLEEFEKFNRAFVVDRAGRLFAMSLFDGALLSAKPFTAPGPVTASPAAIFDDDGTDPTTLYVADQTGTLTAVEVTTAPDGTVTFAGRRVFEAGAPINSSPAVVIGGDAPVIVFGADRFVYAIVDDQAQCVDNACSSGANAGEPCAADDDCVMLWKFDALSPIGSSSPAIDADGNVYIGTSGGTFFAIGGPASTPTPSPTGTPSTNPTPTPTA